MAVPEGANLSSMQSTQAPIALPQQPRTSSATPQMISTPITRPSSGAASRASPQQQQQQQQFRVNIQRPPRPTAPANGNARPVASPVIPAGIRPGDMTPEMLQQFQLYMMKKQQQQQHQQLQQQQHTGLGLAMSGPRPPDSKIPPTPPQQAVPKEMQFSFEQMNSHLAGSAKSKPPMKPKGKTSTPVKSPVMMPAAAPSSQAPLQPATAGDNTRASVGFDTPPRTASSEDLASLTSLHAGKLPISPHHPPPVQQLRGAQLNLFTNMLQMSSPVTPTQPNEAALTPTSVAKAPETSGAVEPNLVPANEPAPPAAKVAAVKMTSLRQKAMESEDYRKRLEAFQQNTLVRAKTKEDLYNQDFRRQKLRDDLMKRAIVTREESSRLFFDPARKFTLGHQQRMRKAELCSLYVVVHSIAGLDFDSLVDYSAFEDMRANSKPSEDVPVRLEIESEGKKLSDAFLMKADGLVALFVCDLMLSAFCREPIDDSEVG